MTTHPAAPRHAHGHAWHLTDYLRTLHKRRWFAVPTFLVVFLSGALSSLRAVPIYEATTQILIEKDARRASSINTVLEDQTAWMDDDFYPTQYKILQSRALALRTAEALEHDGQTEHFPARSSLALSPSALVAKALALVTSPWPKPVPPPAADSHVADETNSQSGRIDSFLRQSQ